MTAQVGDRFKYQECDYTIIALSDPIHFEPADYGITPEAVCSACWRGFWCEYDISNEGIILRDFYVNSKDDHYPEINGVLPVIGAKKTREHFRYMGHHLYKDVNIKMNYTGKILVGKDFMKEYYLHMGFQRAWAYKVLTEFVFEDGCLLDMLDHSETAAAIREEIRQDPQGFEKKIRGNISRFVEESFSTDMSVKAWWIR